MKKKLKLMFVVLILAVVSGCSTKEEYKFNHYRDYYKDIQQKFEYEEDSDARTYTLSYTEQYVRVVYTKNQDSSTLAFYSPAGQGNAYYTQKDKEPATLEYNGCTVAFDTEKELGDTDCTATKLEHISKDKDIYTKYLDKNKFTAEGLFKYCDEYVEKNKDKAVEKQQNY